MLKYLAKRPNSKHRKRKMEKPCMCERASGVEKQFIEDNVYIRIEEIRNCAFSRLRSVVPRTLHKLFCEFCVVFSWR